MRLLRNLFILLAALALPAWAAGGTTTSADLLVQVQRNVACVGRAVQQSGLTAADGKVQPFLRELKDLSLALDALEARAAVRDPRAFDSLREAGLSVAALQSTWSLSGATVPQVTEALRKLDSAFTAYRKTFGREAAVIRDGDSLQADQARELVRLQEQNALLVDRLGRLEGQVARDSALQSEVRALRTEASRLSRAQATPPDFVGALLLAEALAGRWRGIYGWVSVCEPARVVYFNPYAADWVRWNDVTVTSVDLVRWDASDWTWYGAPVDVTWNVDYTVDLSDREMNLYEGYVEERMLDDGARRGGILEDPDLGTGSDPAGDGADDPAGLQGIPEDPDARFGPDPADGGAPLPDESDHYQPGDLHDGPGDTGGGMDFSD